jgi:hypothetical protein
MSKKKRDPRLLARKWGGGNWDLSTRDLGHLRGVLGGDVFLAFCRCFVFSDRLETLLAWQYLSQEHLPGREVLQRRNFDTFLWFAFATLRELAKAVTHLRDQLSEAGLLNSVLWEKTLGTFDMKWAEGSRVKMMRDKGGTHVELKTLASGIQAIEAGTAIVGSARGKRTVLMEGDHRDRRQDSAFVLGAAAIESGLGLTLDELKEVIAEPAKKLNAYASITAVFLDVLKQRRMNPLDIDWTKTPGRKRGRRTGLGETLKEV